MQSVVGEATFSKVGTAPPNMMLSTETRTSAESESKLPELLFICQRPSSYSATLSCCTPLSATKETFEVLDSDETEDGPLKRSVKWRVERRFGEPIICSTFIASRQELQRPGLVPEFLVPETPEAKVTIDNYISNKWKRIRKNLDVPLDDAIPDSPLIVIARERTGGFTSIPSMAMEPERDFIVLDQDMDFENSPWGATSALAHWAARRSRSLLFEDDYDRRGNPCGAYLDSCHPVRRLHGSGLCSWQQSATPTAGRDSPISARCDSLYAMPIRLCLFWRLPNKKRR